MTAMIGQGALAIDKDQIGPVEDWGQPFERSSLKQFFIGRIVLGISRQAGDFDELALTCRGRREL